MQQDRRSSCVMDFFDMDLPGKEVCNKSCDRSAGSS